MHTAEAFTLFGAAHLATLAGIAAVALGVALLARRVLTPGWQQRLGVLIGVLLIVHEGLTIWLQITLYGRAWNHVLPLHLCGIAIFVTAWMLIARSYRAYEIVYFWACAGTLQALLTPDLTLGFPAPAYLVFFIGHGLVVVGVLYAMLVYRFRPHVASIAWSVAAVLALIPIIAPLNLWLDTNYLYLCAKPSQASLMDHLGPWPWYILGLVGVGLVSCFVYYLPFLIADLIAGRPLLARRPPEGPRRADRRAAGP
ncbi:TIGR02206 family membrane protein [Thiococcus pfennigii]|uniref:YwaF family protein n=1 Tax=Thiococcus pfennigii TaxID=1057 RepID=UPI001908F78B|nr:TIGR02206 family membrane protein [Thiococcus pfennigii]MBK1700708.1 TIGR02206 family membrane protein [Thiococcus pfennigii]MBK1730344.1 TIGR02206 family membrane protein [Thiococcus pfennigii]